MIVGRESSVTRCWNKKKPNFFSKVAQKVATEVSTLKVAVFDVNFKESNSQFELLL